MGKEPVIYVVPSTKNNKSHIVDGAGSLVCGLNIDSTLLGSMSRADVNYLKVESNLCKRCQSKSIGLYLEWVASLTEDDLELS